MTSAAATVKQSDSKASKAMPTDILDWLHKGSAVPFPPKANAVRVERKDGKKARAMRKDVAQLKGGGPYSKVEFGFVYLGPKQVPQWASFNPVKS